MTHDSLDYISLIVMTHVSPTKFTTCIRGERRDVNETPTKPTNSSSSSSLFMCIKSAVSLEMAVPQRLDWDLIHSDCFTARLLVDAFSDVSDRKRNQ